MLSMMGQLCVVQEGVGVGAILGPGVYALWFSGEVVYVGKAKQMLTRLNRHRQTLMATRKRGAPPKGWDRAVPFSDITIYPCAETDMDRLEAQLIAKFRPRYNVNLKPMHKVSLEMAGFDFDKFKTSTVVPFVRRL